MSEHLPVLVNEEQVQGVREAFALFQEYGDGYFTTKEFGARMVCTNPNDKEVSFFSNYLKLMAGELQDNDSVEDLLLAFQVFDKEGSGFISKTVLTHILSNLGDTPHVRVVDIIKDAVVNGDGMIDYREFIKMIMPL